MIINMLRAVSKMLNTTKDIHELEIKADCAKLMLDEIISGLEGKDTIDITHLCGKDDKIKPEPTKPVVIQPELKPDQPPFMISVDKDKKLNPIKGLPSSRIVVVDGKTMTHKEAIGLKFTKIKILEE